MQLRSLLGLSLTLLIACLPSGCRSPRRQVAPGPGLAAFDREAPQGTAVFQRPAWKEGDWFDYRRGGLIRLRFSVFELSGVDSKGNPQRGFLLRNSETARSQVLDQDLGSLGESTQQAPPGLTGPFDILLDPVDPGFAWPLWVGKRWSGGFTQRSPGKDDLPFRVFYRVEAQERVQVPAGSFEALRIERRSSLALEGKFIDRVSLIWYAPEIGCIVRRLEDSIVTELEAFQRQELGGKAGG